MARHYIRVRTGGPIQDHQDVFRHRGTLAHLVSVIQDIIIKNTIKSICCVQLFYMNPLKNPSFYA
ncbi:MULTISPECIES: hypothetical protein [unclassified Bartonella]|uniref:hypothetical protein n=1 Tax=unclassified Bartonella TaxID=2645622 RepID=UPI0023600E42|nr:MULTISPECIES: hypothetical protein [unclassified Bartonella]